MRRLRKLVEEATETVDVYQMIGHEVAETYDEFRAQGFIQFESTFNPLGFKILFPKEPE